MSVVADGSEADEHGVLQPRVSRTVSKPGVSWPAPASQRHVPSTRICDSQVVNVFTRDASVPVIDMWAPLVPSDEIIDDLRSGVRGGTEAWWWAGGAGKLTPYSQVSFRAAVSPSREDSKGMSRLSLGTVPLLVAAGITASIAVAPLAAAGSDPDVLGGSASDVVDELQARGYNVEINWTNGFDTKPLSECWVTGINNPGDQEPSPTTFVTVYVDVMGPNHDY